MASLEPRNCFRPAPKPNEKRVNPSCAAPRCVSADAAGQKRSESFHFRNDELPGEVRVKLVQRDVSDRRPRNANGAPNRNVDVDRVQRNSTREKSSKRTPADNP